MEQDDLTITLKQKKYIMKNRLKEKKIPDDYHTLDRAGQVTLICLHTGHNRFKSSRRRIYCNYSEIDTIKFYISMKT